MVREIIAYGNHYQAFMSSLTESEQLKIRRALLLFSDNVNIPVHYIKYIERGIYEFRVTHINKEFRIFFTYDGNRLVILFNALCKKTRKIPRVEIEKAIKLREAYFKEKKHE